MARVVIMRVDYLYLWILAVIMMIAETVLGKGPTMMAVIVVVVVIIVIKDRWCVRVG
jgi:hypothetical protein